MAGYTEHMFNPLWNPPNRFDELELEWEGPVPKARLRIEEDHTQGILSHNRNPNIEFDWSINPYRGCTHACAYCYARTFHETLGYGAGSDFERRIVVKPRAAELLKERFERPGWKGELIAFSGATDCYQPLERRYGLTRACLQVCAAYRNPVTLVTRSPLVVRDLDVLRELACRDAIGVTVSIPFVDRELAGALEPGAPPPHARIAAVRKLAEAQVPVGVSVAPVIPGLNDRSVVQAMKLAREAGARWAWFSAVRLPGAVADVFQRRLRDRLPHRADAVLARIARAGFTPGQFGGRLHGAHRSPAWSATRELVALWHRRLGFEPRWFPPEPTPFRRPDSGASQMSLFGGSQS